MLNEKEFFNAMKQELSSLLGGSYKIKVDDQIVFIENQEKQTLCDCSTKEFLWLYSCGIELKEICRKIQDCVLELEFALKGAAKLEGQSFEEVQDGFYLKVVNSQKYQEELQDVFYLPFLDLAIVAYFECSSNKSESVPFLINNDILKKWNVKKELVFTKAWENMQQDYPMSIGSIEEAMQAVLLDMPFSGSSIEELELNDCSFHILTNAENKFGFTSVFYPDVLKKYGEKFGDFYIVPSSIHEALLFPEKKVPQNWNAKEFANNIRSINETKVAPEEVLSDSLYYYDATLHQVKIV